MVEKETQIPDVCKSAKVGWWGLNLQLSQIFFGDYFQQLFELDTPDMLLDEFLEHVSFSDRSHVARKLHNCNKMNLFDDTFRLLYNNQMYRVNGSFVSVYENEQGEEVIFSGSLKIDNEITVPAVTEGYVAKYQNQELAELLSAS